MTNIETIRNFASKVLDSNQFEIGNPVVINEVSVIPIIKQEVSREDRDYLTLSEAIKEKNCKVIDKGDEVAHILFQNQGSYPILIEEGEIFKGEGTQDRMSVGTVMVQPDTHIEIAVKCVHAPHGLATGADFHYGGKAGRGMLNELRSMKFGHAQSNISAAYIDQGKVWEKVSEENEEELSTSDDKYMKSIHNRQKRAKKRVKNVKFPENTIGVVVIDGEGDFKGIEIHRSPHNFDLRKEGIFESLESTVSWDKTGKPPVAKPKAKEKVRGIFKKITKISNKDALKQVEIDGLSINADGMKGEALSAQFFSDVCPSCNQSKPRKKTCPHCGTDEEADDEMTYMSLF